MERTGCVVAWDALIPLPVSGTDLRLCSCTRTYKDTSIPTFRYQLWCKPSVHYCAVMTRLNEGGSADKEKCYWLCGGRTQSRRSLYTYNIFWCGRFPPDLHCVILDHFKHTVTAASAIRVETRWPANQGRKKLTFSAKVRLCRLYSVWGE